jgi:hypothetical protein
MASSDWTSWESTGNRVAGPYLFKGRLVWFDGPTCKQINESTPYSSTTLFTLTYGSYPVAPGEVLEFSGDLYFLTAGHWTTVVWRWQGWDSNGNLLLPEIVLDTANDVGWPNDYARVSCWAGAANLAGIAIGGNYDYNGHNIILATSNGTSWDVAYIWEDNYPWMTAPELICDDYNMAAKFQHSSTLYVRSRSGVFSWETYSPSYWPAGSGVVVGQRRGQYVFGTSDPSRLNQWYRTADLWVTREAFGPPTPFGNGTYAPREFGGTYWAGGRLDLGYLSDAGWVSDYGTPSASVWTIERGADPAYIYTLTVSGGPELSYLIMKRTTPLDVPTMEFSIPGLHKGGSYMDVDSDGMYLYLGLLTVSGTPRVLRFPTSLESDAVELYSATGGNHVEVACGHQNPARVYAYGNLGSVRVIRTDNSGRSWTVVDDEGWSGVTTVRPFLVWEESDDAVTATTGDQMSAVETEDAGENWVVLSSSLPFKVGAFDLLSANMAEGVLGRGAPHENRVMYTPNAFQSFADWSEGTPDYDVTKVIVG